VNTRGGALRTRNVAAVLVTAEMPPFVGKGSRIDVTVSSLGDASSLMGGTLVMTPLTSVDGVVYAVAQGQLAVSGFAAQGRSEVVTEGVPTAARISNGALVEREIPYRLADIPEIRLELRNPDFRTAAKVADAINAYAMDRWNRPLAAESDLRSIRVMRPPRVSIARFMAEIGELLVEPETSARVVIDARTGTIVIGQDVRVSAAAITHGALTVRVTETPQVSQPQPFSRGETTVTSQTSIGAEQSGGNMAIVDGPNLRTLVRGLNQIGLKPTGIIAILQALKSAGALHAEIVVQ
jgi:flagellar P-ring protein precursor FlgI